jgi:hypothetical protein
MRTTSEDACGSGAKLPGPLFCQAFARLGYNYMYFEIKHVTMTKTAFFIMVIFKSYKSWFRQKM